MLQVYRLIDTAGIRRRAAVAAAGSRTEELSVNRAFRAIRRADVVALVIDAMACVTEQVIKHVLCVRGFLAHFILMLLDSCDESCVYSYKCRTGSWLKESSVKERAVLLWSTNGTRSQTRTIKQQCTMSKMCVRSCELWTGPQLYIHQQ